MLLLSLHEWFTIPDFMNVALIIPTLNAGPLWERVLKAIDRQPVQPNRKILLDTCSEDATVELAKKHGFEVHTIRPEEFNHGLTRQHGFDLCPEADVLTYMTQDAVPADPQALKNLFQCLENEDIAAAYGRQLPPPETPSVEAFARLHNYPPESRTKSKADIQQLGLQTAFCSNSFAAWRRTALENIGGFPATDFGEDMLAAAKLILAGHSVAYCAEAAVLHAHPLSLRETFRRGRQIGALHRRHPWLRTQFGRPEKSGDRYVQAGTAFLARESPLQIPCFLVQSSTKLLGFLSGKSGVF